MYLQALLERKGNMTGWTNGRDWICCLVPHWRLLFMNAFNGLSFCFFPKQTFSSFWLMYLYPRYKESQNWIWDTYFFPSACYPSSLFYTFHTFSERLLYSGYQVSCWNCRGMWFSASWRLYTPEGKTNNDLHSLPSAFSCPIRLWTIFPFT